MVANDERSVFPQITTRAHYLSWVHHYHRTRSTEELQRSRGSARLISPRGYLSRRKGQAKRNEKKNPSARRPSTRAAERAARTERAAGSDRTAATTAMPPRRRLKRRRRGRKPWLRSPTMKNHRPAGPHHHLFRWHTQHRFPRGLASTCTQPTMDPGCAHSFRSGWTQNWDEFSSRHEFIKKENVHGSIRIFLLQKQNQKAITMAFWIPVQILLIISI